MRPFEEVIHFVMLSGEAQQNGSNQAKFAARNDRSAFPDSIGTQADDQGITFGAIGDSHL